MNVLLSCCTHWWNAEAGYAAALAEELLGAGHRAIIWTQADTPNSAQLARRGLPLFTGVPPAGNNPLAWWRTLRGLRALHARENFDIVDVFRSPEFPFHLLAARGPGGPTVVRTRGSAQPVRANWINRKMYGQWAAGLIASSEVVRQQMATALGLGPHRISRIYYPVEAQATDLARPEMRRGFLAKMGIAHDRFVVGIVGRLYAEKGHGLLLAAFEGLVRRVPHAQLIIFAKQDIGEDPERAALESQVREARLESHVVFSGPQENIRQAMGYIDVGVIPSIASEVICRVAVEFLSSGTPVVAFPTGALPEVVEHEVSGLVTSACDAGELAAALERLAGDGGLRTKLAAGAIQQAETRFSRRCFLQKTLAAYESALHHRRRPAGDEQLHAPSP